MTKSPISRITPITDDFITRCDKDIQADIDRNNAFQAGRKSGQFLRNFVEGAIPGGIGAAIVLTIIRFI